MNVNKEFLFGCATGNFDNWQGTNDWTERKGIKPRHAYSIMEAREVNGERLLRIRSVYPHTPKAFPGPDVSEGIPGEAVSGTALGVTAPNSGRQSGWNSWDIGLATMA